VAECSGYRVFLSCSKRDKVWGKWLQSALDNYRIDRDLVGRRTPAGAVPKALGPVYRDHAIADDRPLGEPTLAILRASQYLVVLCSPDAAKSRCVNEQIRYFTSLGRADRIIPVIVDGEPGDPARECFAPALRFSLRHNRLLTDRRGDPVAATARLDRDGKERVKHKVAAALLCLCLHDVERGAHRVRKRRLWIRSGSVVIALLALGLAWQAGTAWARYQLSHDGALLERTLQGAALVTSSAVAASNRLGIPRSLSAWMLQNAEDRLRAIADFGRDTPQLRLRRVAMLIEFVQLYGALGEAELLQARASEAKRLLQRIATEEPGNPAWQRELAAGYDRLGDALRAYGMSSEALASYRAGLAWAERIAADPGQIQWRHELALGLVKIGNGELDQGALGAALASFQRSRLVSEHLTAVNSGNPRWRHDVLIAHERIGEVARRRGELEAAIASYLETRALAERLVAGDAANPQWQRALSQSHLNIGDVLRLLNKPEEALASYRAGHAIAARLAAAAPGNSDRQEHLGAAQQRLGSALEACGEVTAALAEHRASLAIARRLAAANRGNAGWQHNLAMAHRQLGDLQRSGGDLDEVLQHYQASRAIVSRLAAAVPGEAELQYDLAASHARVGLVSEARGDREAALKEYEAAIAIAVRFAADESQVGWKRDLAVLHARLAGVLHAQAKSAQALAELRRGREIMAALLRSAPGFEPWRQQLAHFDGRIAALEGRARTTTSSVASTANSTVGSSNRGLPMPALLSMPPKL
jgi:tetratricopeptide (TPR) repeat protein